MFRKISVLLLALAVAACDEKSASNGASNCTSDCLSVNDGGPVIVGSGTIKTEVRAVEKFTAIRFAGAGRLVVERSGAGSLAVTADDNLLPLFTSEVKYGTLYLAIEKGKSLAGKLPIYTVGVTDLRALDLSGSGSAVATKLEGVALLVTISGSGSANFAGTVDDLTISISGSGAADAAELKAKRAKVVVSGSGELTVNTSDELDARIAGSGRISYIGTPKLTLNVSGSGTIRSKAN
jgi:hypothetical protein